jgi:hypothetical protein
MQPTELAYCVMMCDVSTFLRRRKVLLAIPAAIPVQVLIPSCFRINNQNVWCKPIHTINYKHTHILSGVQGSGSYVGLPFTGSIQMNLQNLQQSVVRSEPQSLLELCPIFWTYLHPAPINGTGLWQHCKTPITSNNHCKTIANALRPMMSSPRKACFLLRKE